MAEGIAKEHFKKINKIHRVLSRGLQNIENEPASSNAVEALEELEINISRHKSNLVTRELMETSDLILTMTIAQRDLLRITYFDIEDIDDKEITFNNYSIGEDKDIEDP